jgi:hypothetical protein
VEEDAHLTFSLFSVRDGRGRGFRNLIAPASEIPQLRGNLEAAPYLYRQLFRGFRRKNGGNGPVSRESCAIQECHHMEYIRKTQ